VTNRTLVSRAQGPNVQTASFNDKALQDAGNIAIDDDAYSVATDLIYETKGLTNMHVQIINTGGANGLTYTIEKTRKEFLDVTTLVDADFNGEIKADTNLAFGAISADDIIDVSPESTAIRVRVKRQTAGQDTTMTGIVSCN